MSTVKELREQAASIGVKIPKDARKAEIEEILAANQGTSVEDALRRDLTPEDLASPLGATALSLARALDGQNSATSKAQCARSLIETLARLDEKAPPKEKTELDRIRERRAAREGGPAPAS